jgi:hypothetical protein
MAVFNNIFDRRKNMSTDFDWIENVIGGIYPIGVIRSMFLDEKSEIEVKRESPFLVNLDKLC